jgi:hypothetical protein
VIVMWTKYGVTVMATGCTIIAVHVNRPANGSPEVNR